MDKFKNKRGVIPLVALVILAIGLVGGVYMTYRFVQKGQPTLAPSIKKTEVGEEPTESGEELQTTHPQIQLPIESAENEGPAGKEELTESPKPLVNFSKSGNLLNRGGWLLLYEEPGNPAIDASLKFTKTSLCDLGKGLKPCDLSQFEHGSFVSVKGNQSGREVTVFELKKL